jgi:hypothetical protein
LSDLLSPCLTPTQGLSGKRGREATGDELALSHEKPRVEPRTKALIKARIRDGGTQRDVCILDVSTRGLLATTARPPQRGEFVELLVGDHLLTGQVKWAGERRFGLALRERISVAALVAGERGPIALKHAQSAKRRSGSLLEALGADRRSLGRAVQFGIMLVVLGAAAWLLADYAGDGLSSLQEARTAMSGRGAD